MYFDSMLEHPDITRIMRDGYPAKEEEYRCEVCENVVDEDDMYEDRYHEILCKNCLLDLHQKGW